MSKAFITKIALVGVALASTALRGEDVVKISDPTSVVMIVNRDSNDLGFMDLKTHKIVGRVFLGNNVNPHMVMMSPDGRYVVTGGTRANKAYVVDVRTFADPHHLDVRTLSRASNERSACLRPALDFP